jgi:hypothetical protein
MQLLQELHPYEVSLWDQNWLMEGLSIPKPTDLQLFGDITKVQDKIHGIFDSNIVRSIVKTRLFDSVRDE